MKGRCSKLNVLSGVCFLIKYGYIISALFILWTLFQIIMTTQYPIVIADSSMIPTHQRGDIFFLHNKSGSSIQAGDLVMFTVDQRPIRVIHRVVKVHRKTNGDIEILTKGDTNTVDDKGLYPPRNIWLKREDIKGVVYKNKLIGQVCGILRSWGMIFIVLRDYALLRYFILGGAFIICFYLRT